MVAHIKSSLECIQMAWAYRLRDFRQWCKPEGQAVYAWKTAPLKQAILACRSNMIDDAEAMLKAWVENSNHVKNPTHKGLSAFIPVMTTAIAAIQSPPEYEQVIGRSEWLNVVIPNDPLQRVVQLRSIPSAFRCQIAFFCPDTHGAMMVANQFCLYWKNEAKRTFAVPFELGKVGNEKIIDNWQFRVLDNSLYPDTALSDYKNLTVVTVDCTLVGDIPVVGGLGGVWDEVTDTGETGTPEDWIKIPPSNDGYHHYFSPIEGGRKPIADLQKVVTEADVYDLAIGHKTELRANKDTGEITQTEYDYVQKK